ncbi:MAG: hypothetical protein AAB612_00700 [Patescibacteria group bacterium]
MGKRLEDASPLSAEPDKKSERGLPDQIPFKWGGERGADHGSNKTIRQAIGMAGEQYQWLLAPKVLEEKEVLKSYYIRSVASDDPRSLQYQGLELIPGGNYMLCLV